MVTEMHCHTAEHSACSSVKAEDLVKGSIEANLDAIVITDHHYEWQEEEIRELRKKTAAPDHFRIFSGQEVETRDFGHVLVYGAGETIPQKDLSISEIKNKYPASVLVWAHPYRFEKNPSVQKLIHPDLDGIEIFNSNYGINTIVRAIQDWQQLGFQAMAGTDTHAASYIGSYPVVFDNPVKNIKELAGAIRGGRCRPYFREAIHKGTSSTKVQEIEVGPKKRAGHQEFVMKTFANPAAWKMGERSFYIAEEIFKTGFAAGDYRIPKPILKEQSKMALAEECIPGKTLMEVLQTADQKQAQTGMRLVANWLAKLHSSDLKVTPDDEFLEIEPRRLAGYVQILKDRNHKFSGRIQEIANRILEIEKSVVLKNRNLVQAHGDFHPKNIFLGTSSQHFGTPVTVIDLASSFKLPRAFDVGTFMAQYFNMTYHEPEIRIKAPIELFLTTYMEQMHDLEPDFLDQIKLFKARTFISVLYYLEKVKLGKSENFWTVLLEAERNLASRIFSTHP